MCIGNNRYAEPRVDFNDTILLGLEVRNPAGLVEHVMGYYNKVRTRPATQAVASDFGWEIAPESGSDDFGWHVGKPVAKAGNAMLFAVPAKRGTLKPEDSLIKVSDFPRFMEDYKRAVAPRPEMTRSRGPVSFSKGLSDEAPVVVKGFDNGTYDVVIAPNASSIATVIGQVDAEKRPQLNLDLYKKLDLLYPGFYFVLFCFSEKDADQAGCALIKYQPIPEFDHLLYLPGLDGHNGDIETGQVPLNHTLVVGSYAAGMATGMPVEFSDRKLQGELPYYLLSGVIGKVIPAGQRAPQGDFLFKLDDVRKGTLRAKRQLPPGWKDVFGAPVPGRPYLIER